MDTGLGETEVRIGASWARGGGFLDSLRAAGVQPAEIDTAVCPRYLIDSDSESPAASENLHRPDMTAV